MGRKTKLLVMLGVAFVAVLMLSATAFADDVRAGVVTGNGVNGRKEPNINSKVITNVPKDAKVIVLGHEENWFRIAYNGVIAYMSADYLIPYSNITGNYGYGEVSGSYVYMRAEPGSENRKVATLTDGLTLKITGVKNGWYAVEYGKYKGYMHPNYVVPVKKPAVQTSSSKPSTVTPKVTTTKGQQIVNIAKQYIGVPYKWGGTTPRGFDCSGFTQYVYAKAGIKLYHRTQQYKNGTSVKYANLSPGDLVFFDTNHNGTIGHVGIYVGNGKFIHAPRPGKGVEISPMTPGSYYYKVYVGARRVVK